MTDTAVSGNVRMDYCRFGEGEKTLVILPGLSIKPVTPMENAIRGAFLPFLKGYTVYLFDRRNDPPESYSIERMAEDTATVMKALGLKNTVLFGASQGGMIAQALAAGYPELVKKLILGSTSGRTGASSAETFRRWTELARRGDGYGLNAAVMEDIYSERTMKTYRDALLYQGKGITAEELSRFLRMADPLLHYDGREFLSRIRCKTLVLGSEGDRVFPAEDSRALAEALHAELYLYGKEFGHAVYDEAPDYRERMLAFAEKD